MSEDKIAWVKVTAEVTADQLETISNSIETALDDEIGVVVTSGDLELLDREESLDYFDELRAAIEEVDDDQ